ncbi:hypothetical protein V5O48_004120 [Marasmius crinis-equi]|uniref:Uncharacterized protein n=1 Tax=Marasmius crinis-equi TaxID=585013 RepID=A0ABR3FRT5_9AGAR
MHPTLRVLSGRAHTPLIRFLGKRHTPSGSETPHVHPAAPAELRNRNFSDFATSSPSPSQSKSSSSSSSSGKKIFTEFWEAPERIWRPKIRQLEDWEIDVIQSGGASLH